MKVILCLLAALCFSHAAFAHRDVKYVLHFGPTENAEIEGVHFMIYGTKKPVNSVVNGINVPVNMFPLALGWMDWHSSGGSQHSYDRAVVDTNFNVNGISAGILGLMQKGTQNGLAFSPFPVYIDKVNGISLSIFGNTSVELNGLAAGGIFNSCRTLRGAGIAPVNVSKRVRGIQIGLYNKTRELKGLQVGLWNVNSHRHMPFVNW